MHCTGIKISNEIRLGNVRYTGFPQGCLLFIVTGYATVSLYRQVPCRRFETAQCLHLQALDVH